jgi:hypothetical protein
LHFRFGMAGAVNISAKGNLAVPVLSRVAVLASSPTGAGISISRTDKNVRRQIGLAGKAQGSHLAHREGNVTPASSEGRQ